MSLFIFLCSTLLPTDNRRWFHLEGTSGSQRGGTVCGGDEVILPYAYSEGTSNQESLPADLCCAIAVLVW